MALAGSAKGVDEVAGEHRPLQIAARGGRLQLRQQLDQHVAHLQLLARLDGRKRVGVQAAAAEARPVFGAEVARLDGGAGAADLGVALADDAAGVFEREVGVGAAPDDDGVLVEDVLARRLAFAVDEETEGHETGSR